jgi:class 3 adenylate cyclase
MEPEQPVRVGRRLAAVVAADVAGYSRLMGLDEVGTARTLREHRKVTDALVAKHGGRLVKTTGDGVLLEFPSVVDAVEYAVRDKDAISTAALLDLLRVPATTGTARRLAAVMRAAALETLLHAAGPVPSAH